MAGAQHQIARLHILAYGDDVLAAGDRLEHLDLVGAGLLGALHHHHRVGALRERAARVDERRLALADRERRGLAHRQFAHHLQVRRQRFAGADGVLGADGVAIHHRAGEVRQRVGRGDILGQHAPQRLRRRYSFRGRRGGRQGVY